MNFESSENLKLSLGRRETRRANDRPVNYTDAEPKLEKKLLLIESPKNHHKKTHRLYIHSHTSEISIT